MEALAGEYIRNYLHVKRFPLISLVCKLVPGQYREYAYGLLRWLISLLPAHANCFLKSEDPAIIRVCFSAVVQFL